MLTILLLAAAGRAADLKDERLQALVDAHQWFALRDAVRSGQASSFYRGMAAAAFQDVATAERELRAAIASGLDDARLRSAHQALANAYQRSGQYAKAVAEHEATPPAKPPSDAEKALAAVLKKLPAMAIASKSGGSVAYSLWEGEILAPVTINGKTAQYILDSDANMPAISASEARRLGLEEAKGAVEMGGVNGQAAPGAFRRGQKSAHRWD